MRDSGSEWWADAFDLTLRAERLRRQFFRYAVAAPAQASWEPPVDILEAPGVLEVTVALPGVAAERIDVVLEHGALRVRGRRPMPIGGAVRTVHRLEIPYGLFERRIALPAGRYRLRTHALEYGCLRITLHKLGESE